MQDELTGQYTILVADDVDINLLVLKGMLLKLGYRIVTAVDGLEAVRVASEETPDLVLMDISMPGMNGIDAAKRIQVDFGEKAPPIVAVTANVTQRQRSDCKTVGFQGFVEKPVDFNKLGKVIEKLRKRFPAPT